MSKANRELLGEDFGNAVQEMMKYTSRFEVERAWIREDLGYTRK